MTSRKASPKIILLGEQGSGKSTVARYISKHKFPNLRSLSDKRTPPLDRFIFDNDKRGRIEIVDTPPFNSDLTSSFTKTLQNARDTLDIFNEGFSLLVYCMPAETRVRTTYLEHMLFLKSLFGEEGLSHVCIMVTHLNNFMPTRKEELRNIIGDDLPKRFTEWGLEALQKIFFIDTDTENQPPEEFLSSFFDFMESKERINFLVQPIDDPENPFCVLDNTHFLKYLSHITKKQKEAYEVRQNIIFSRNNASSYTAEISLRVLEGFQALKEEETLDSLLLRVKGSYIPFLQDVVNYFERRTVNQSPSLIKDIGEVLEKADDSSLIQKFFGKVDRDKLVSEVQAGIYEKILKSAATLFSKNIDSNKASLNKVEERLEILLRLCTQFKHIEIDEISGIDFVNKTSVVSSTLTFLSLMNFSPLIAFTSTLTMAIIGWRVGNFLKTKTAMLEIATKMYDELYHSHFSKMLFVCMLIIYSDLYQEVDFIEDENL